MRPSETLPGSPTFVHLRLHTEYSLADGIVRVPRLMQAVVDAGMPAVALTDHGNLFAMVKFHREAERRGVKPVIGADLWIADGNDRLEPTLMTLLAQGEQGFRQEELIQGVKAVMLGTDDHLPNEPDRRVLRPQ